VGKDENCRCNYHTVGNDFVADFALYAWVPGTLLHFAAVRLGGELRWGDDETDYTDDADELRKLARLDSAQE
jgi:hypothetical protein